MATEIRKTPKTFDVYIPDSSDDPMQVAGRMKAIREAKALSDEKNEPVVVQRDDGRVKMRFRDGRLIKYAFRGRRA